MKKKLLNSVQLDAALALKKEVKNSFTEDGAKFATALNAFISELETAEVEFTDADLKAKVDEWIASYGGDVPVAVADAIAKKIKAVQDSIAPKRELSHAVKNQICGAILRSNKNDYKEAVNAVLVKNEITGLSFGDVVDYAISEAWEKLDPLFAQLKKVFYTKFFYTEDEMATADVLAKQWDKTLQTEKVIQELAAQGKSITTKYVYKRQRAPFEDLDEIEKAGEQANFLRWLNEEIDRMIVNTIVMAILVGDSINALANRVTTFESIGKKTVTDVFTKVTHPAVALTVTVEGIRTMCDEVKNPNARKKVLVMSQTLLTALSKFLYAAGGSVAYKSKEEMAGTFGVDEIYTTDVLELETGLHAICFIPEGYWYNEKKAIDVAYPTYEKNVMNYQKERNCGGAIHDLFSSAILREAAGG